MAWAYQPDVLLLEVALPGLDGLSLVRAVRQQARFRAALLVAVTGYADDPHRRLGQQAGFDHYLAKPAEPTTVRRLLWLEKERLADSPGAPRGPAEVSRRDYQW